MRMPTAWHRSRPNPRRLKATRFRRFGSLRKPRVELRARAEDDDRAQAQGLQEGEPVGQRLEAPRHERAAHLDDGEAPLPGGRELVEIGAHLAALGLDSDNVAFVAL